MKRTAKQVEMMKRIKDGVMGLVKPFHEPTDFEVLRTEVLTEIADRVSVLGWQPGEAFGSNAVWQSNQLGVLVSVEPHGDGEFWLHVSCSRYDHILPGYYQLAKVKRLFIGEDRLAFEMHPPKEEHVNLMEVRHLWCCLTRDVLNGAKLGETV